MRDVANGYDALADEFARCRSAQIGVPEVRAWAAALPDGAAVLDMGCGTGVPITEALVAERLAVHAIDASPRMIELFRARFPGIPAACEPAETNALFGRQFDGVLAWGLLFLLPLDVQDAVIASAARALVPGGRFLFTSPAQNCSWSDSLTGRASMSPGREAYAAMLARAGLTLGHESDDEGGNHYYHATRSAR